MKYFYFLFNFSWKLYVIVVFTLTGCLLFPLIRVLLLRKKWQKGTHHLFVVWSWSIRIFCFYPIKKVVAATIPNGPYIVIANHSSYLDIFFMPSLIPSSPLLFLGKSELLKYPILGTYFRKLHIPVFRTDKVKSGRSFIKAKSAVKEGWSLMIFPEGGIPNENLPQMIPFKEGAFKLAKNLRIPIVPVTFTNNFRLFSDLEHFSGPARPGISRVYIHKAISVKEIESMTEEELIAKSFEIINGPLAEIRSSLR